MLIPRLLAAVLWLSLGLIVACGGDDDDADQAREQSSPTAGVATATQDTASTATPAETTPPAPTPTPAPYDGSVASMKIPRFGVDSAIEAIGLRPGVNELDVPQNPYNTGWYHIYAKPGFGRNAVFSAHVDYYPNIKGPFFNLAKIDLGDDIIVTMENGLAYEYEVITKVRYRVEDNPMGQLIDAPSRPEGKEWITLITCGGDFVPYNGYSGPGFYLHRDVVVAQRVN